MTRKFGYLFLLLVTLQVGLSAQVDMSIDLLSPVKGVPFIHDEEVPVRVELRNRSATQTVSQANVTVMVDGAIRISTEWKGNLSPGGVLSVDVGSITFTLYETVDLSVRISSPNGLIDPVATNDYDESEGITAGLSGIYDLDGTAGNFTDLYQAMDKLHEGGVLAPVTIRIPVGTQSGEFSLYEIPGASETNTVTFIPASGIAGDSILNSTGTLLKLNRSSHLRFEKLHFSADISVVYMKDIESVDFDSCQFLIPIDSGRVLDINGDSKSLKIEDSVFVGGSWGVHSLENSSHLQVLGCEFSGQGRGGMYLSGISFTTLSDNRVLPPAVDYSAFRGIWVNGGYGGLLIQRNEFLGHQSGTGIDLNSFDGYVSNKVKVFNNLLYFTGESSIGIRVNDSDDTVVSHNSVNMTGAQATGVQIETSESLKMRNNIFSCRAGGVPFRLSAVANGINFDGNVYYTAGQVLGVVAGVNAANMDELRNLSGTDPNSFKQNPAFVADASLVPRAAPLLNGGQPQSDILTDFLQQPRDEDNPSIGAYESFPVTDLNDAGIPVVYQPTASTPFGAGDTEVLARLENYGTADLTSVELSLRVTTSGGFFTRQIPWTGNLGSGATAQVSLGTITFDLGVLYDIEVRASTPNGVTDEDELNDSRTESNVSPMLTGAYRIGYLDADFATLNEAAFVLRQGGVLPPVNFDVAEGVYNEILNLDSIRGSSNPGDVVFTAAGNGASLNGSGTLIHFENMAGIEFRNFKLQTNADSAVEIVNSTAVIFYDTEIELTTATSQSSGVRIRGSTFAGFYNTTFTGGETGIWLEGDVSYFQGQNLTLVDQTLGALRAKDADGVELTASTVRAESSGSSYVALRFEQCGAIRLLNNDLTRLGGGMGMEFVYCGDDHPDWSLVANNTVSLSEASATAVKLYESSRIEFYHNSLAIQDRVASKGRAIDLRGGKHLRVRNNIFANLKVGYAMEIEEGVELVDIAWDYNGIFSAGKTMGVCKGIAANSMSNWRNATGLWDANSVYANPGFISATDLHATAGELVNKGTPLPSIPTDMDGQVRSTTAPSIGADEIDTTRQILSAGLLDVVSPPLPIADGEQNITVTVRNNGNTILTSLKLETSLDGMNYSYVWTASPGLTPYQTRDIVLTTHPFSSANSYDFTVTASEPNGGTDISTYDDSFGLSAHLQATVTSITAPLMPFHHAGKEPIRVVIQNTGDMLLTSMLLSVRISSTAGPDEVISDVLWTGLLGLNESDEVTLGTYAFPPFYPYTIQVTATSPNGGEMYDQQQASSSVDSVYSALGGEYSVKAGSLFTNPYNAFKAIQYGGMTSPVTLQLQSNTYVGPEVQLSPPFGETNPIKVLTTPAGYKSYMKVTGTGIYLGKAGMNFSLEGVELTFTSGAGIYAPAAPASISIVNSTITGTGRGIEGLAPTHSFVMGNSTIMSTTGGGIYLRNGSPGVSWLVENNLFADIQGGEGIYLSNCQGDLFDWIEIRNNFIHMNSDSYQAGVKLENCRFLRFWHNTVKVEGEGADSATTMDVGLGASVDIRNNIFANYGTGTVIRAKDKEDFACDSNGLFTGGAIGELAGMSAYSLSDWTALSGKDSRSVYALPLFHSDLAGANPWDLHTRQLDYQMGAALGFAKDRDGENRDTMTPTVGADEIILIPFADGAFYPSHGLIDVPMTDLFSWPPQLLTSGETVYYRVQASTDPNYEEMLHEASYISTNELPLLSLLLRHETLYWWRVNAWSDSMATRFSDSRQFKTALYIDISTLALSYCADYPYAVLQFTASSTDVGADFSLFEYSVDGNATFAPLKTTATGMYFDSDGNTDPIVWDVNADLQPGEYNPTIRLQLASGDNYTQVMTFLPEPGELDNKVPVAPKPNARPTATPGEIKLDWTRAGEGEHFREYRILYSTSVIEAGEPENWTWTSTELPELAVEGNTHLEWSGMDNGLHAFAVQSVDDFCNRTIGYSTAFLFSLTSSSGSYTPATDSDYILQLSASMPEQTSIYLSSMTVTPPVYAPFVAQHFPQGRNLSFGPGETGAELRWDINNELPPAEGILSFLAEFELKGSKSAPVSIGPFEIDTMAPRLSTFAASGGSREGESVVLSWSPVEEQYFSRYGIEMSVDSLTINTTQFGYLPPAFSELSDRTTGEFVFSDLPAGVRHFAFMAEDEIGNRITTTASLLMTRFFDVSANYCALTGEVELSFAANYSEGLNMSVRDFYLSKDGVSFTRTGMWYELTDFDYEPGAERHLLRYRVNDHLPYGNYSLSFRVIFESEGAPSSPVEIGPVSIITSAPPDQDLRLESWDALAQSAILAWNPFENSFVSGQKLTGSSFEGLLEVIPRTGTDQGVSHFTPTRLKEIGLGANAVISFQISSIWENSELEQLPNGNVIFSSAPGLPTGQFADWFPLEREIEISTLEWSKDGIAWNSIPVALGVGVGAELETELLDWLAGNYFASGLSKPFFRGSMTDGTDIWDFSTGETSLSWTTSTEGSFAEYELSYTTDGGDSSILLTSADNPLLGYVETTTLVVDNLNQTGVYEFSLEVRDQWCNSGVSRTSAFLMYISAVEKGNCSSSDPGWVALNVYSSPAGGTALQVDSLEWSTDSATWNSARLVNMDSSSVTTGPAVLYWHARTDLGIRETDLYLRAGFSSGGVKSPMLNLGFFTVDTKAPEGNLNLTIQEYGENTMRLNWTPLSDPNFSSYSILWQREDGLSGSFSGNDVPVLADSATDFLIFDGVERGYRYTFTLTGYDSYCNRQSVTRSYALISIASTTMTHAEYYRPYSRSISLRGAGSRVVVTPISGELPQGLRFDGARLSGTPTEYGDFEFEISVLDATSLSQTTGTIFLQVLPAPPLSLTIQGNNLIPVLVGEEFKRTIPVTGGVGPLTHTLIQSSLPGGISLSPNGTLTGISTQLGVYSFRVLTTDVQATGYQLESDFSIEFLPRSIQIASGEIPGMLFDEEFEFQLLATGGSGDYTWEIVRGQLPEGFELSTRTGVISGRFDMHRDHDLEGREFEVRVRDNLYPGGSRYTTRKIFSLKPDLGSYGWEIYRSGMTNISRSYGEGDYCYVFFTGMGMDLYFGVANSYLSLPSEILVDGEEVALQINEEWDGRDGESNLATAWRRFSVIRGLEEGEHIMKLTAPTDGNELLFESPLIQHQRGYETYFTRMDVTPDRVFYRSGSQAIHKPKIIIDPRVQYGPPVLRVDMTELELDSVDYGTGEDDETEAENEEAPPDDAETVDENNENQEGAGNNDAEEQDGANAKTGHQKGRGKTVTGLPMDGINHIRVYYKEEWVDTIFPYYDNSFMLPQSMQYDELQFVTISPDDPGNVIVSRVYTREEIESTIQASFHTESSNGQTQIDLKLSSGGGGGCLLPEINSRTKVLLDP